MVDQRKGDAVNIQILRRGDQWLKLRDILTWKWQGNSAITFELQRSRSPVYRRAVSVLCKAMVCNYSELFLEPSLLTRLKPISAGTPAHLSWHLSDTADSIIFYDDKIERPARPVESRYDCERRARADINNKDFSFHDHPALLRLVQLYRSGCLATQP